jgi:hypothetical protein
MRATSGHYPYRPLAALQAVWLLHSVLLPLNARRQAGAATSLDQRYQVQNTRQ